MGKSRHFIKYCKYRTTYDFPGLAYDNIYLVYKIH